MEILRRCITCSVEATDIEDLELFLQDNRKPHGRANKCKKCNKEKSDRDRAKRMYKCTLEEYRERMSTSSYCEICGSTQHLRYDHDHNTMEFRGVLCNSCNISLGTFGDSVEGLMKAIKYLKGTKP